MWTKPNLTAVPFAVVVGGVPLLRRGGLPLVLSLAACPLRAWQQMPPKKSQTRTKAECRSVGVGEHQR